MVLGSNHAAQLHAEASLANCTAGHWGIDGLKPYMRYTLAGGYQSNSENVSGSDYCVTSIDGYRPIGPIESEAFEIVEGFMGSPGHRDNILDKSHKRVSIGLAWDKYNIVAVQHFEGDYIEYDLVPTIRDGVLGIAGRSKKGVRFTDSTDLGIQVYYDPPPYALTRGQVSRTYCYDGGMPVAGLREPLSLGWFYDEHQIFDTYHPCPNPYHVDSSAPGPQSDEEAHEFWQRAYYESEKQPELTLTVPWVTASEWVASGDTFAVTADLNDVLNEHGDGVYTVVLWGIIGAEDLPISEYSVFHGVTPPSTYSINP